MTTLLPPPSRVYCTCSPHPERCLTQVTVLHLVDILSNTGVFTSTQDGGEISSSCAGGATGKTAFSPSLPPSLAFLGIEGGLEVMPFPPPHPVVTAGPCVSGS